ncbi:unnamed protein product [Closterium sp. Naga37s-1]|nr:unnamed protein product [Closterium sp. Naga37s-1]
MSPQSDPVSFQPEAVSSQSEPVSSQVPAVSDWDAFETQLRREADEEPIIEVNATTLNRLFELLTASNPTALTSPPATPSATPSSSFHSTTPSPSLPFPHPHTSPSPPTSTHSASESKPTPSEPPHTCPSQTGHQGTCDSGSNTATTSSTGSSTGSSSSSRSKSRGSRSGAANRASVVCRAACVLVYTDWCPFSSQLRVLLSSTAPLFPHILHVAIDKKELRPSVLSRMGVYSVPALFLQNSTTRIRYRGPRTAAHLSEYISAFTRCPTSSPFSPLQPSPNPFATDSSPLSLWFGWDQPASAVTWGSKRAGSDSPSPAADSAQAAADSSQAGASTGASIHAEAEGGAVDEAGTAGEEAKPFLHGVASSFHMCPYMAALEDSKRQTRHLQQQQWWQQGGELGVVRGGKGARGEGRRGVVCPYAWAIRPESLLSESFCLWFSGVFLMGRCLAEVEVLDDMLDEGEDGVNPNPFYEDPSHAPEPTATKEDEAEDEEEGLAREEDVVGAAAEEGDVMAPDEEGDEADAEMGGADEWSVDGDDWWAAGCYEGEEVEEWVAGEDE